MEQGVAFRKEPGTGGKVGFAVAVLALVGGLVAYWLILPSRDPTPPRMIGSQAAVSTPDEPQPLDTTEGQEPEDLIRRIADLEQEIEELNWQLQDAQDDATKREAGLERCVAKLNQVASIPPPPPPPQQRGLRSIPQGTTVPRQSRRSGRVSSIRDAWIQILGDFTVVRGKLYSTGNDRRTVQLYVDLFQDGNVADSTVLELTIAPGETLPWEVELATPFFSENLSARQRIRQ